MQLSCPVAAVSMTATDHYFMVYVIKYIQLRQMNSYILKLYDIILMVSTYEESLPSLSIVTLFNYNHLIKYELNIISFYNIAISPHVKQKNDIYTRICAYSNFVLNSYKI